MEKRPPFWHRMDGERVAHLTFVRSAPCEHARADSLVYFLRKSTRPRRTRLTPKAARSRFATLAITSEPAGPNTRPTLSAWNRTRNASAMLAPKARIVTGYP